MSTLTLAPDLSCGTSKVSGVRVSRVLLQNTRAGANIRPLWGLIINTCEEELRCQPPFLSLFVFFLLQRASRARWVTPGGLRPPVLKTHRMIVVCGPRLEGPTNREKRKLYEIILGDTPRPPSTAALIVSSN